MLNILPQAHEETLRMICNKLSETDIIWVLTASASLAAQGMDLIPSDIDIQTNDMDAYKIAELLKEIPITSEILPVEFSTTEKMRSHFGRLEIGGVLIEIMGNMQKYCEGEWEEIPNLPSLVEYMDYKDMKLPIFNIAYEAAHYKKMKRFERAAQIEAFMQQTDIVNFGNCSDNK